MVLATGQSFFVQPKCTITAVIQGDKMEASQEARRKFWSMVQKNGRDGCWLYTGTPATIYGRFVAVKGQPAVVAHRFSWFLHTGKDPVGLLVLHRCPGGSDTKCVNPRHLYLGTHASNMADMIREGRGNLKLNWEKVDLIRELAKDRKAWPPRKLAKRFGVTYECIHCVLTEETWKPINHP